MWHRRWRAGATKLVCARHGQPATPDARAALVAAFALCLTACGTSPVSEQTRPTVRPTDANAVDAASCPSNASTVKAAASGEPPTVRVALIVPRTGAFPHWAQFGDGARAYFESLNAKPEAPVRFEVTEIDDQLRATETKSAVERATTDGTDLIVGIPTVANVDAVRTALSEACIPLFTPAPVAVSSVASSTATGNDAVVSSGLDLRDEVRILLGGIRPAGPAGAEGEPSGPRVALVYQDNSYGRSYLNAMTEAVHEFDAELVASEPFDPVSAPDPRDAVGAAAKADPDVLVVALEGASCPDALSFIPSGSVPQVAVSGSCTPDPVIADAGRAQVGVRAVVASLQPRDPDQRSLAAAATFVDALTRQDAASGEPSTEVTNLTAEGWNVASIAAAAVDQARSEKSLSRTGILSAARSLKGPAPTMWPASAGTLDGGGSATRSMLAIGQLSERTATFWRPIPMVDG